MISSQFVDLREVHDAVRAEIDVILFTVLAVTNGGRMMTRLYSSHTEEYPVGRTKSVEADVSPDWLTACLQRQEPYFGGTKADLERIFADSVLIESLGCGSSINAPVVKDGWAIGVLNILGPENAYTGVDVVKAVQLAARSTSALDAARGEPR